MISTSKSRLRSQSSNSIEGTCWSYSYSSNAHCIGWGWSILHSEVSCSPSHQIRTNSWSSSARPESTIHPSSWEDTSTWWALGSPAWGWTARVYNHSKIVSYREADAHYDSFRVSWAHHPRSLHSSIHSWIFFPLRNGCSERKRYPCQTRNQ